MRPYWPPAEPAQADYETLREAVLTDCPLIGVAAARFERSGLAALVAQPVAEPVFAAEVIGALRPAWTPQCDPRLEALGLSYQLLLELSEDLPAIPGVRR